MPPSKKILVFLFLWAGSFLNSCRDVNSFAPQVSVNNISIVFNGVVATFDDPVEGARQTETLGQIVRDTDKNKNEFPYSSTSVLISASTGGFDGRRCLRVDYSVPVQTTPYACGGASSYAYGGVDLQLLPPAPILNSNDCQPASNGLDISRFSKLDFWVKTATSFPYVILLSGPTCKNPDPCNPIYKTQYQYPAPGLPLLIPPADGQWHETAVSLASFMVSNGPNLPAFSLQSVNTITFMTQVSSVGVAGTVFFDNVILE